MTDDPRAVFVRKVAHQQQKRKGKGGDTFEGRNKDNGR